MMRRLMGEMSPMVRWVFMSAWLLTATMLVVVLVLYTDNKRTKQCLSDYIVEDQAAAVARIAAGQAANDAETQFFADFAEYSRDRSAENAAKTAASLDEVAKAKLMQKETTQANPQPEVPESCR